MTSSTDICKRALAAIGTRSTIANMQEAGNEARNCLMLYQPTRDMIMRAAHWNFARKTAQLSLLKAAPGTPEFSDPTVSPVWIPSYPAPPWLYEYAYPSDCLKGRYVVPQIGTNYAGAVPITSAPPAPAPQAFWQGPTVRFLIATSQDAGGNPRTVILTNQSQAIFCYTTLIDNPDLWDSLFAEAVVAGLAARLAMALTGDKTTSKNQAQQAMGAINQARVADGNEGPITTNTTPDWILARGYAADWIAGGYFLIGWDQPFFPVM